MSKKTILALILLALFAPVAAMAQLQPDLKDPTDDLEDPFINGCLVQTGVALPDMVCEVLWKNTKGEVDVVRLEVPAFEGSYGYKVSPGKNSSTPDGSDLRLSVGYGRMDPENEDFMYFARIDRISRGQKDHKWYPLGVMYFTGLSGQARLEETPLQHVRMGLDMEKVLGKGGKAYIPVRVECSRDTSKLPSGRFGVEARKPDADERLYTQEQGRGKEK